MSDATTREAWTSRLIQALETELRRAYALPYDERMHCYGTDGIDALEARLSDLTPSRTTRCNACRMMYDHTTGIGHTQGCAMDKRERDERMERSRAGARYHRESMERVGRILEGLEEPLARRRRCSECGHVGHNARTCGAWVAYCHTCTDECSPHDPPPALTPREAWTLRIRTETPARHRYADCDGSIIDSYQGSVPCRMCERCAEVQ